VYILPINEKTTVKITKYSLRKKFDKQLFLLSQNPKHPSLHVELLEPKQYGVYSFRINLKYRALFIFRPDKNAVEILNVTVHYQ
jgi:plasmid maintenance system killer protein